MKRSRALNALFPAVFLLVLLISSLVPLSSSQPKEVHVYYGYVPPSTDLPALDEMVMGNLVNFTPPPGVALLDITGFEDGTKIEIYDIVTGLMINATVLNAREKKYFYIPYGTYFKVVSTKRVGVLLTGGWGAYDSGWWFSGVATFYPTIEGGFRGKHYIFMPAPPTHQYLYTREMGHYNFFIYALEDVQWRLKDRTGKFDTTQSLKRGGFDYTIIQSRVNHMGVTSAAGYDSVFELETTGEVMVCSAAIGALIQVPALTGGFVGRQFWVPNHENWKEEGRAAVLIIIPLEPGEAEVLRADTRDVLARREFTADDVARMNYWFVNLGSGRFNLLIKSTGDITVLAAQTWQQVSEDHITDGIAVFGSRPNQEVRFFTPSSAVIFSTEDQEVVIDGMLRKMKRDEFTTVGSGVHSVKGTGHLIIQIISPGSGFQKWGHYLIETADVDASYPEVPELFEKGIPIIMYAGVAAIVIVAAIAVLFLRRRKKA